ncbi:hypothetical protein [Loktanella sp. IMCC34160]|uniref:hypothetical protein n=1 Tax=Loktanella sp. IMCC34160 TaxID=2510646 RepID=UPI0013ED5393|nr:hypothetical protein [Loktanella sp. IMCC34160]
MVGSNKILTVSYGTFSCTLEGFDESFDTMKAIAEYFRDLAADDRYFGAEPPTPDAEMLARIAEKEIARRVEARMESSGLVLRATGALEAAPQPVAEPVRAEAPAMPPAPAVPATQTSNTGDEATAFDTGTIAGPEAGADEAPPLAAAGPVVEEHAAPEVTPEPEMAEVAPEAEVAEADAPAEVWEDVDTTIAEAPAHPDSESVAAKLQRIRAVVGRSTAPVTETEDFAEDLSSGVVDSFDDEDGDDFSDAFEEALLRQEEAAVEPMAEPEAEVEDDEAERLAAVMAATSAENTAEEEPVAEVEADDHDDIDAEIEAFSLADFDADESVEEAEPLVLETVTEESAEAEAEDDSDVYAEDSDLDEAPAPQPAIAARVLRMSRRDYDAAVAEGRLDDVIAAASAPETVEDDVEDQAEGSGIDFAALDGIDEFSSYDSIAHGVLSDEDEAELLADLAEAEQDEEDEAEDEDLALSDDYEDEDDLDDEMTNAFVDNDLVDDDEDEDEVAPVAAKERPGRALLGREPEADDDALSRLMSRADAQMSEPDGSRRREAISHLKAAVAATEAARQLGDEDDQDEKAARNFREDLSRVVRPARPAAPVKPERPVERRTERPRPAPLKLVASQRVDAPEQAAPAATGAPVTPVRPRRPAAAPAARERDEANNFAEFAESVGANGLAELLEAAAAYTSFVEGMDDFSRPQIMNKVREIVPEEFSREDGLRSFGTLLREGRISKVRNGRFQIADDTRYRPDQRVAAGR